MTYTGFLEAFAKEFSHAAPLFLLVRNEIKRQQQQAGKKSNSTFRLLEMGSGFAEHAFFFTQNIAAGGFTSSSSQEETPFNYELSKSWRDPANAQAQLPFELEWLPTELAEIVEKQAAPRWDELRQLAPASVARAIKPPQVLDIGDLENWAKFTGGIDLILSVNVFHIAPEECAFKALEGSARVLNQGGTLLLYGPFKINNQHISESNVKFDAFLRSGAIETSTKGQSGIRDLDELEKHAKKFDLILAETIRVPENNFVIIFKKQ